MTFEDEFWEIYDILVDYHDNIVPREYLKDKVNKILTEIFNAGCGAAREEFVSKGETR